ncbi:MAG: CAP domain-containing protein [Bacteroidia bacterium]|nr:CAP domain-containing protein [Bacteroidia bacterium]
MNKNATLCLICLIFLGGIPGTIQAQTAVQNWNRQEYQTTDHSNFRKNKRFEQKINADAVDYALLNACIFFLTNEQRVKENKSVLSYAAPLEVAAWHHARRMAEEDFFGHEDPKSSQRKTTDKRARLAGISNPYIAENVAGRSFLSNVTYLALAEGFMEQWMNSPGHRSNILSDKALQLGSGAFTNGKYWYATQCYQWFKPIVPGEAMDTLP